MSQYRHSFINEFGELVVPEMPHMPERKWYETDTFLEFGLPENVEDTRDFFINSLMPELNTDGSISVEVKLSNEFADGDSANLHLVIEGQRLQSHHRIYGKFSHEHARPRLSVIVRHHPSWFSMLVLSLLVGGVFIRTNFTAGIFAFLGSIFLFFFVEFIRHNKGVKTVASLLRKVAEGGRSVPVPEQMIKRLGDYFQEKKDDRRKLS